MKFIEKIEKAIFDNSNKCLKKRNKSLITESDSVDKIIEGFLENYIMCIHRFKSFDRKNEIKLVLEDNVKTNFEKLFSSIDMEKIDSKKLKIVLKKLNIFIEDALDTDDYYVIMNALISIPKNMISRFKKLNWLCNICDDAEDTINIEFVVENFNDRLSNEEIEEREEREELNYDACNIFAGIFILGGNYGFKRVGFTPNTISFS